MGFKSPVILAHATLSDAFNADAFGGETTMIQPGRPCPSFPDVPLLNWLCIDDYTGALLEDPGQTRENLQATAMGKKA